MSQGSSVFHAESRALMNERVLSATPQETRPPCRKKVTHLSGVAPALFGPMANVGFLDEAKLANYTLATWPSATPLLLLLLVLLLLAPSCDQMRWRWMSRRSREAWCYCCCWRVAERGGRRRSRERDGRRRVLPSRLPFPCSIDEKVVFPLLLSLALARCCWFCCCWLHCCCCRLVLLLLSLALFQQLQLVLLLLQLLL